MPEKTLVSSCLLSTLSTVEVKYTHTKLMPSNRHPFKEENNRDQRYVRTFDIIRIFPTPPYDTKVFLNTRLHEEFVNLASLLCCFEESESKLSTALKCLKMSWLKKNPNVVSSIKETTSFTGTVIATDVTDATKITNNLRK